MESRKTSKRLTKEENEAGAYVGMVLAARKSLVLSL